MDIQPLISIIIPLYNCELYISQCIQSIKLQTYTKWEAIIINDGSTDNSKNICKESIQNDKRFIFIDKNNEGVSITRNKGLQQTNGDFIFFLDADDYLLDNHTFERLINIIQSTKIDFIRFEYKAVDCDNNYLFNNKIKYLRRKNYYQIVSPAKYCHKIAYNEFFLCFSFFKSSIIKNKQLNFIEGCRMREDADFIIRYLSYCQYVMYIPDELYAYRKHNNAATSLNSTKYESDLKSVFDSLNSFKETCMNIKYKNFIFDFLSIIATEQRHSQYGKYYQQIVKDFPIQNIRYKLCKCIYIERIYLFIRNLARKFTICINMIIK